MGNRPIPKKRALVGNAADAEQVGKATRTEQFQRDEELADLKHVIGTPMGRRVIWRLLSRAGAFRSTYDDHASRMAYNAGQQDVGHFILAEVSEADPEAWMLMQIEANHLDKLATDPETDPTDA